MFTASEIQVLSQETALGTDSQTPEFLDNRSKSDKRQEHTQAIGGVGRIQKSNERRSKWIRYQYCARNTLISSLGRIWPKLFSSSLCLEKATQYLNCKSYKLAASVDRILIARYCILSKRGNQVQTVPSMCQHRVRYSARIESWSHQSKHNLRSKLTEGMRVSDRHRW